MLASHLRSALSSLRLERGDVEMEALEDRLLELERLSSVQHSVLYVLFFALSETHPDLAKNIADILDQGVQLDIEEGRSDRVELLSSFVRSLRGEEA